MVIIIIFNEENFFIQYMIFKKDLKLFKQRKSLVKFIQHGVDDIK